MLNVDDFHYFFSALIFREILINKAAHVLAALGAGSTEGVEHVSCIVQIVSM